MDNIFSVHYVDIIDKQVEYIIAIKINYLQIIG